MKLPEPVLPCEDCRKKALKIERYTISTFCLHNNAGMIMQRVNGKSQDFWVITSPSSLIIHNALVLELADTARAAEEGGRPYVY